MSATPSQKLEWRAELQGAEGVKAKMSALLALQREGLNVSEKNRFQAKLASQEISQQTRAMSALGRSWQVAHPQLALLTRGFSNFAAVGRTVFNILQGINIMQIRQRQDTRDLHEAQQKVNDSWAIYVKMVAQFGKDSPQALEALQNWNKEVGVLVGLQDRIDGDKWQDLGVGISAVGSALDIPANVLIGAATMKFLLGGFAGAGAAIAGAAGFALAIANVVSSIGLLPIFIAGALQKWWDDPLGLKKILAGRTLERDIEGLRKVIVKFFVEDIPKAFQIANIRALKWMQDMWDKIVNVFNEGTKKALNQIVKWKDDIIKFFVELAKKVSIGSIWPDMLDAMLAQVREKLPQIADEFEALGTRVISSIERIDSIARTRSLTGAERQELHGSQVSAHVLGGMAGVVNTTRQTAYQSVISRNAQAFQMFTGRAATGMFGEELTNILRQSPERRNEWNEILFSLGAPRPQGGTTVNITVQGSLIAEKDLINKVSEGIAQGTQSLIR